jgi:putative acyl-CoA dehydrogenase
MECLGGNGYVEESLLPRLYREAPVNAIWEGSGNVMCLDVLRVFASDGEAARATLTALADEAVDLPGVRDAVAGIEAAISASDAEASARAIAERIAVVAAAAALRHSAPAMIAEAFARTRLAERQSGGGGLLGTSRIDAAHARVILERALAP